MRHLMTWVPLALAWQKHARRIRDSERPTAAAWDHARETYREILSEREIN
jgi:hypothetical protein